MCQLSLHKKAPFFGNGVFSTQKRPLVYEFYMYRVSCYSIVDRKGHPVWGVNGVVWCLRENYHRIHIFRRVGNCNTK